jgi:hypothetical protein
VEGVYHWNDKQALAQAIEVCTDQSMDFEEIRRWSIAEGFEHKFNQFLETLKKHDSQREI